MPICLTIKTGMHLNLFSFLISKKDVYSKSYLMLKKHKADQRLQKKKHASQSCTLARHFIPAVMQMVIIHWNEYITWLPFAFVLIDF